jgi:predicted MPP superfamily phosphohydrolase
MESIKWQQAKPLDLFLSGHTEGGVKIVFFFEAGYLFPKKNQCGV